MKPLTDATLRVRDTIYMGLLVKEGEVLTEAVARDRANNIATAVIETLIEGLEMRLRMSKSASGEIDATDARARAVPGQDVISGAVPQQVTSEITPAGRRFFEETETADEQARRLIK